MEDKLYFVKTTSGDYVVLADSFGNAGKKTRDYIGKGAIAYVANELKEKAHFSLETRLGILEEVVGKDYVIR